jgi:2-succinyl-6-hydroxy-2,4-cyclohexadiene-1-carboxylate synthase
VRLAASVAGRGSPVVLVHGFTQTRRSWRRVAAEFVTDHEVITVDAPGHGESAALTVDLWGGADALVATGGSATYIGYSMGGRLALHAALSHPESVQRLVLLGATPGLGDAAERAARRSSDELLAQDLERDGVDVFLTRWMAGPLFSRLPPDPVDATDRRRNTAAGLASSLRRAGTGSQDSLWDRLAELGMPVLVLAGELDDKFATIGRRMAEAIGANAEFALVTGAGHAAHLEQPDEFVRLIRAFVDG